MLMTTQQAQSISSIPQQYSSQQQLQVHSSQANPIANKSYSLESDEGDVEDNRLHSSSSKSNLSEASLDHSHSIHSSIVQQQDQQSNTLQKQRIHQFLVRTFSSPTKCNHCTSLMIGKLL